MKQPIIGSIAVLTVVILSAFSSKKEIQKLENSFVPISDDRYCSKTEVTNADYRAFLQYLEKENQLDELRECEPDSNLWSDRFEYACNEPWVQMYHWHPGFNNYPVVNISKKAMESYCKWLTEQYHLAADRKYKKVIFRLPNEREWQVLAAPLVGHVYPWYGDLPYTMDAKGNVQYCANVKARDYAKDQNDYAFDGALLLGVTGYYPANNLNVYDAIGNAAEMTSEGKVKGGSWDNYLEECAVNKTQDFTAPDPRVGFRVVMEIITRVE